MLGALSLLLGKRADFSVIRDPEKKCVIEGSFDIGAYGLEALFSSEDLDYEPMTIIRREILPSGKSRAFINDTPAKVSSLQVLGERLLDIHSQHETLSLGDTDYQFLLIDALADNELQLKSYQKSLLSLRDSEKQLQKLKEQQLQATKEYDYNLFLLQELEQVRLEVVSQEELEERYEELNNVEQLTEQISGAVQSVQQEDLGAAASLKTARAQLQKAAGISSTYEQLLERIQSVSIELDDIAAELESALEKIEADPQELEEVNSRLQVLYNLQKKHMVSSVSELIEIRKEIARKVAVSENAEEELQKTETEISRKRAELSKKASELHERRKKVIPGFITEIGKILSDVGMPNANFKIELQRQEEFFQNGQDKLSWLLAANKGGSYNDIKKAASGGELSRIMLAVKSILASYSKLPTIIFDEIDTGVSGDIAQRMAGILQKMGRSMQVIAITHLPQIAGRGDVHFKIFKKDRENSTTTEIKELSAEERVDELAVMLGGKNISASAVAHAKQLLN